MRDTDLKMIPDGRSATLHFWIEDFSKQRIFVDTLDRIIDVFTPGNWVLAATGKVIHLHTPVGNILNFSIKFKIYI